MKRAPRTALVAAVFLMLLSCLALAVTRSPWRSDRALKSHFIKHRGDFEKLAGMANEDVHLTRIASDFTWLDDSVAWPRSNVGISEERWNNYRKLFRQVDDADGIVKNIDPPRIFFPIVSAGLVPTGYTKGIVYSPEPLSPVLKSLDEKPPDQYWKQSHVLVYKPIEDHWYIYFEQW